ACFRSSSGIRSSYWRNSTAWRRPLPMISSGSKGSYLEEKSKWQTILNVATRCARTVALFHPTSIHMYYLYEDRHIRLRVSDQIDLDDFGVWSRAHGDEWIELFRWSPYMAESERPQVFVPGDWIPYL